ncbi:putative type IX secretion system sortase PorU2 [Dyadobacter arcticus]|uniref:Gingipain domain-containing protein n=1 Tax=Dyadobacter arcticus TaxID=1078754 RepID=A0ABX0UQV4_9BACT|nr:C25 family cysteine peptidase [Dyadobacter arcticus]NIJ55383.1 hypothetical protein [Dyadobacter arcticus]
MVRIFAHTFVYSFFLFFQQLSAQKKYGNEWINPSQSYFKIPVAYTGLYQITKHDLSSSGISIEDIPPTAFQMFRQGKEIAIDVNFGSLGNEAYITFYGEKNDGHTDSSLYISPGAMPHSHYSLYSDTAAYFLSWRVDGGFGKRISEREPQGTIDSIAWNFEESIQLFTSHYLPGNFYPPGSNFDTGSILSDYDVGEGWTGPQIPENQFLEITFNIENAITSNFEKAEIELLLAGWTAGNHSFELWSGPKTRLKRKLSDIAFSNYNSTDIHAFLKPTDIGEDRKMTLTILPVGKGGHVSLSYGLLKYPQQTRFKDILTQKKFSFDLSKNRLWMADENSGITFYDVSDPLSPRKLRRTDFGILLDGSTQVLGVKQALNVSEISQIHFRKINPLDFDYLIISHPLMHLPVEGIDPVNAYAAYRASTAGGRYEPLIINSSEVYNQFNFGDPGPQGIRNMISWLHNAERLKFVFLIGRSIDPQKARKSPEARQVDMVPNAGWPGSDIALTMDPADSTQTFPSIPIGRINALTSQNVHDYLLKVKAVEAEPASAAWRKNILHLSGGRSRDELSVFKGYVKSFEQKISGSAIGASIATISKQTDDPVEQLKTNIPINKGAALVTLFGHSSLDVTDIDIGYASDPKRMIDNHPRYPAVVVNGCALGSIFYSDKTLSSDWIFAPKSGAALFLAHTFNGVSSSLKRYTDFFYEVLADSVFTNRAFGEIQQEMIKRNLQSSHSIYDRTTIQQMTLHGDPAIRIFPAALPDYLPDSSSVGLFDLSGKELNTSSDSILVKVVVRNNGRYKKENYQFTFRRMAGSTILQQFLTTLPAPPILDTMYFTIPNNPRITEKDQLQFIIDEDNKLLEENEVNNKLVIRVADIQSSSTQPDMIPPLLMVEIDGRQLANNDAISSQPTINIELVDQHLAARDTTAIVIWLKKKCTGCVEKRVYLNNAIWKSISPEHISVEIPFHNKLANGSYLLTVQAKDLIGNFAPLYQIDLRVSDKSGLVSVNASPNPTDYLFRFTLELEGTVPTEKARLFISDISGKLLLETSFQCHPGLNEWTWDPGTLPTGAYLYRIMLSKNIPPASPEVGKALSGRLLWVR